jgi:fatty aldehyde-generating acyl-ACP reductase
LHKFAFIVHPLEARDAARKYGALALLPDRAIEFLMGFVSPKTVSYITGIESPTGARTEGWFVGCPLTSRQFRDGDPVASMKKVVETGRVAQDLGAEIVGLGAFTSVVGDAGITIARELDIAVTTGNSYTIATAVEGAVTAAGMVGHDIPQSQVTILGATGSIGRVSARLLASRVRRVVLNARTREKLEALAEELAGLGAEIAVETDTARALADADIVIAVTSAVETVVEPRMLKVGAVICDAARPRDVSVAVARERDDVLVIEGGSVAVPGDVDFRLNFGFPPREAYACMAETMVLALEGKCQDYSLGRDIKLEQVQEIAGLATRHGFGLAGFRSFERRVSDDDIARIRDRRAQARG